jgi:ribosomal protein L34
MNSENGRKVLNARRAKGRHSLTPQRPQKKSIR